MTAKEIVRFMNNLPEIYKERVTFIVKYNTPMWRRFQLEVSEVKPRLLTFEEAGRAIRISKHAFGKPIQNYTHSYYHFKKQRGRLVIFRLLSRLRHYKTGKAAVTILKRRYGAKVTSYSKLLVIQIPKDCFVSSFYTSEKPKVWKQENEKIKQRVDKIAAKKEFNRKVKEVGITLDRSKGSIEI